MTAANVVSAALVVRRRARLRGPCDICKRKPLAPKRATHTIEDMATAKRYGKYCEWHAHTVLREAGRLERERRAQKAEA